MIKNVAFFVRHFSERGTELSIFNYAKYNRTILGNKSLIIAFNKYNSSKSKKFINTSRSVFEKEFRIINIENINEIKEIITKEKLTHAYIQSHGFYRDFYKLERKDIWGECKTIYHYVFGPMARQGSDIRCVIGEDLNKKYFKKIPVLPYMVLKHRSYGDLRGILKINKDALVIGRHGGESTFDINFVKNVIKEILNQRKDIIFLFLNTQEFYKHERIIYLPKTTSSKYKSQFIDTCDLMIHARKDGETFGLAVAEFSAANKPVITYAKSKDKEHLRILNKNSLVYRNKKELFKIFKEINREYILSKEWNSYKNYEPEIIIEKFNKICLGNKMSNNFGLKEFVRDLPWECIIILNKIIDIFKKPLLQLIPIKLKRKVKDLLQHNNTF